VGTLNTGQPGHWYKCMNPTCDRRLPLPDKLFLEADSGDARVADCECGHMNLFAYSDAENKTTKSELDMFFSIKDPRVKFVAFWEETKR